MASHTSTSLTRTQAARARSCRAQRVRGEYSTGSILRPSLAQIKSDLKMPSPALLSFVCHSWMYRCDPRGSETQPGSSEQEGLPAEHTACSPSGPVSCQLRRQRFYQGVAEAPGSRTQPSRMLTGQLALPAVRQAEREQGPLGLVL